MKCLLCNLNFLSDETLKNHYIWQHLVNEDNFYFKDLFAPDVNLRGCDICKIFFKNSRTRKNNMFLLHYNQMGGNRRNQQLPIKEAGQLHISVSTIINIEVSIIFFTNKLLMTFWMLFIAGSFLMVTIRYRGMLK